MRLQCASVSVRLKFEALKLSFVLQSSSRCKHLQCTYNKNVFQNESTSNIPLCFGRRRFGGPIFLTSAPLCASSVLRFLAPLKHETWRSWLMISARIFRWKILLNSQGFLGISSSQCSDLILNIKSSPYIPDHSGKSYTHRFDEGNGKQK